MTPEPFATSLNRRSARSPENLRPTVATLAMLTVLMLVALPCRAQTDATASPDADRPTLDLSGFVQVDGYVGEGAADDSGDSESASTFLIRRARLGAKGKLTDRLSYNVLIALDGSNSSTVAADVKTFNAFLDVRLRPAATLRIGQFKYEFDREGRRSGKTLPLITRPAVTNAVAGRLGRTGGSFRDVGVELSGEGGRSGGFAWSYALGVVNGNGIDRSDDNGAKDVYGRLTASPGGGWDFGLGVFSGSSVVGASDEESEAGWTADLFWQEGDFGLVGGYYQARYERPGAADQEPRGFALTGSWRVRPKVELVARFQAFDQDTSSPDRRMESVDVGFNYYFLPKGRWGGTKLALTYLIRDAESGYTSRTFEERGDPVAGSDVGDALLMRFQLQF